jgi:hypothetical protein
MFGLRTLVNMLLSRKSNVVDEPRGAARDSG